MMHYLRTWSSALLLVLLLIGGTIASPTATAAPPPDAVYDALGDSYASGYGVPPYGPCGRSASAYAVQLDGRQQIALDDFVACAGATTVSLVTGGQLTALDADTDLVTLTIGGNDIGWSSAVTACLGGTDVQCTGATELVRARITNQLPGLLTTVYAQVAAAAPNAHVVVTGYPRLFSPKFGAFLGASSKEQGALNDGADLLNSTIKDAADAAGFQFVDVASRFDGHGVNAPAAWILGPFDPAPFHPNINGYKAYTAAINSALGPVKLG
ncbi:UNVERIFIED_CONTAM: lysophospholipase L1-like esterase [Williamsia faeni]